MNQRNVEALANLIRVSDGNHSLGAGELAERLASHGVLVPSTLTDDNLNLVYDYLEGIRRIPDKEEEDELLPSSRGAVRTLERIAKGETD